MNNVVYGPLNLRVLISLDGTLARRAERHQGYNHENILRAFNAVRKDSMKATYMYCESEVNKHGSQPVARLVICVQLVSNYLTYQAVREFGVCKTTLYNRLSGSVPVEATLSTRYSLTLFTPEEESQLVNHLTAMVDGEYGLSGSDLREITADYAVYTGHRLPGSEEKALSAGWLDHFLKRHPKLQVKLISQLKNLTIFLNLLVVFFYHNNKLSPSPPVKWQIMKKVRRYTSGQKTCNVCLLEKLYIVKK